MCNPPAMKWFNTLENEEEVILPGYVVMEASRLQERE